MQLIADLMEFLATLSIRGVAIGLVVGLIISFVAWQLMPVGSVRAVVSAVSFVVGFAVTLCLAQRHEGSKSDV